MNQSSNDRSAMPPLRSPERSLHRFSGLSILYKLLYSGVGAETDEQKNPLPKSFSRFEWTGASEWNAARSLPHNCVFDSNGNGLVIRLGRLPVSKPQLWAAQGWISLAS
jgi:hypothetical protein